ncbi:unnamed protein product [Durusdinium trenchii]|uniref:tRNA/rRNA methyltransferase SpoU type domain-containing protein n=1 Tax=Durusdinium trenchii TaxID=1381693 RepID=A0ABP0Q366_9DINO
MAQRIPSFVPPPAAQQPQVAWQPSPGLPSPEVIQKQKEGYIRLLDEQLKQGQNTLDQQRKQQSEYLHTQAQQQKQQVEMQIKQQVQQQEMQLLQQYNQSLMQVQQASAQQKAALESQAMQLVMEYQQKRSQEEMLAKQQQLQRGHIEAQMKFAAEMQKLQVTAPQGGSPVSQHLGCHGTASFRGFWSDFMIVCRAQPVGLRHRFGTVSTDVIQRKVLVPPSSDVRWVRCPNLLRNCTVEVVLEGVRNSANQQMILRTCEALGVQEVWLVPPPAGVKYRATMVRSRHASRGAERFLTLHRLASVKEVAERCQAEGRELWVSYCPPRLAGPSPGPEAVPLTAGSVSSPLPRLALVLGTESDGISTTMLRQSNRAVFLPMYGFVQSLNVAVACGMLLQRLFDLCPEARGDLNPIAKDRLVLTTVPVDGGR